MKEVKKGIYLIKRITESSDNNERKYYVGQAIDIFNRLNQHCCDKVQYVDKEIQRLGVANFKFQILEEVSDKNDLDECESKWISHYKETYGENMMYNLSQTSNTNPYDIGDGIKKTIKELFKQDIGQSIYAISDHFKICWEEVVKIRKPLAKKEGLTYDSKRKRVIVISTGAEPDNWRGAIWTKKMADKILGYIDEGFEKEELKRMISKADLDLFLEMYAKGNYAYAPELTNDGLG